MPRSTFFEFVFALLFAVTTTGIAGFMITSDTQTTARERLLEIDRLKEDRCAIQMRAMEAWVAADETGQRAADFEALIRRLTRKTPEAIRKDSPVAEVDKLYRELEARMKP